MFNKFNIFNILIDAYRNISFNLDKGAKKLSSFCIKKINDLITYLNNHIEHAKKHIPKYFQKYLEYTKEQHRKHFIQKNRKSSYSFLKSGQQKKSVKIAFLLWFFLMPFAPHRFYVKDPLGWKILLLGPFTLFIWPVLDAINIPKLVSKYNEETHNISFNTKKTHSSEMIDVDQMDGYTFELFLGKVFKKLGYRVQNTPKQGDYGADLILRRDGKMIIIQAKRYNGNVGVSAIQEVISAKYYYGADESWVVTNSYYTKSAIELASRSKVNLLDRKDLIQLMKRANLLIRY